MTKTETIRARVEPRLKHEAESILKTLGLSPADAIRLFYRQISLRRGLPFAVEIPNADTREAMEAALDRDETTEWPDLATLRRTHG